MTWLLPRAGAVALAVFGAALLGLLLGGTRSAALTAGVAAAVLGAGAVAVVDALRGHRLMRWLRGTQLEQAPRDSGFWGEMAYRFERALRSHETTIRHERQRLEQFLSAIEASPNGVLLLDAHDQIDWCNSVAAEHFGLEPGRDMHQRVTNLVRSPVFVAYLQGERFDEALQLEGSHGRSTLSVLVRPYGDGMKLVLSSDITERERADAMRRDFVANVSHEIRSPLTVLAGFVETMEGLPLTEAERKRVLVLMAQQTDRMQALVADLLILARLEGSPRPPSDRWVPVAELIERCAVDALALSRQRHVLAFDGGDGAEIAGSQSELLSALTNLVHNAIRYTPEGGRIDVRWRWRLSDAEDGATAGGEIEVVDSGIGITRDHIGRLTERFYRVDGSRSRDTGGTGLGLSIVKHVVQRHGGEIDIHSEPGRGSTFKLVFPAMRVRRAAGKPVVGAEPVVSA